MRARVRMALIVARNGSAMLRQPTPIAEGSDLLLIENRRALRRPVIVLCQMVSRGPGASRSGERVTGAVVVKLVLQSICSEDATSSQRCSPEETRAGERD